MYGTGINVLPFVVFLCSGVFSFREYNVFSLVCNNKYITKKILTICLHSIDELIFTHL